MHADKYTKHRWDRFSESYNPGGLKPLRDLLLRYENGIGGCYFAELLKVTASVCVDRGLLLGSVQRPRTGQVPVR